MLEVDGLYFNREIDFHSLLLGECIIATAAGDATVVAFGRRIFAKHIIYDK